MSESVAIIGAGIVGLSVAAELQRDGYQVTVFDRSAPMHACSAGNAGYISEANIFPPATLDIVWQLPKLLLSNDSPLVIRPSYLPAMISWGRQSLRTLKDERSRHVTNVLAGMTVKAYASLRELAQQTGAGDLLTREGGLVVFKDAIALEKKARVIPQWRSHGLVADRLDAQEVQALEPGLSKDIVGGIYFRNSGRCANPQRLGLKYADHVSSHGGVIQKIEVTRVQATPAGKVQLSTSAGARVFDRVVVCCGYWSAPLLADHYKNIPLVSERGYHLMLPNSGVKLCRPIVFGEPHFAATPMEDGLRLAGTAEFANADAAPNMKRAYMLLELAKRYLGSVSDEGAKPWMGVRPSLPDGLPAVGKVPGGTNIFYAFGHSHNGLTLSALTAQSVAALMANRVAPIDLDALSLERFV